MQTVYFLPFLAVTARFPLVALLVVATLCLFFGGSEFSSGSVGSPFKSMAP